MAALGYLTRSASFEEPAFILSVRIIATNTKQ